MDVLQKSPKESRERRDHAYHNLKKTDVGSGVKDSIRQKLGLSPAS